MYIKNLERLGNEMELNRNLELKLDQLEPQNRDLLKLLLLEIENGSYNTYIEDKVRTEIREIVAAEVLK